ncbi:CvpA family protein [Pseudomarimonas salicorniae]|uniref:CvpA family protein n=1 Tax=Pseudomarimonas salicorniae TaxID=2933270 RepID=A0ABT0GI40_9GAMM|nr:CvpA family protein [Lysobacter sp. CAU 1642]MCK7593834.1 CvpA family protein [Lysobacter sp. CAU 1642]
MSAFDIVLLGVLLVSGLLGLWRGFVAEVMSLTTWILAFWAAFAFGDHAAAWLGGWIDSDAARNAAGYVGTFILVLIVGGLMTWLLTRLVEGTGLSGTDRVLGFGFGVLRGAAVCVVGVLLMGFTALPQRAEWSASPLVAVLQPGAEWLRAWLPEPVAARVQFPPFGPPTQPLPDALPPT